MQWPIRKRTMTTMTTTTAQTITAAPTTGRWKWSGETEEPNYDDDERTTNYKEYQKKLNDDAWNEYAHARDDDDDEDTETLTVEEQSRNSNFGLCCYCKKTLKSRADFLCNPQFNFYRMCTKCHEAYSKPWYLQPNQ